MARWDRALVTGASSGIGDAFARLLAAEGSDLVVVARSEARLDALASELTTAHGINVEVLVADLTDATDLARVEDRLRSADAPVDLLVNNAGFGTSGSFVDLDRDGEVSEIRLNVVAVVRLTSAALQRMLPRESGAILNISSGAGFQPSPYNATYGATKAFVNSFTEAVHQEVRGRGVMVSALCPGLTRTEFQERADYETSHLPEVLWMEAEAVARIGLDGVAGNTPIVVPGAGNKIATTMSRMLPSLITNRLIAAATKDARS